MIKSFFVLYTNCLLRLFPPLFFVKYFIVLILLFKIYELLPLSLRSTESVCYPLQPP